MRRTVHNVQLPVDFAQRLLDNEIQFKLADTPSKQVINNLIELYTYGVEYYESIKSYKYLYFQTKMKQLFNGGSTLEIINKKIQKPEDSESPVQKKMRSALQEEKIEAFKIKQKQQKMLNEIVQRTSYTVTSSQTKNILKDTEKKEVEVQKVIHEQIETQKRSLQEKLKLRKTRNLVAKSMSSIELFETSTRESLFGDSSQKKLGIAPQNQTTRSPIKVNFQSFINENDESEEGDDQITNKRKKNVFSSMRVLSKDELASNNQEDLSAIIENCDFLEY